MKWYLITALLVLSMLILGACNRNGGTSDTTETQQETPSLPITQNEADNTASTPMPEPTPEVTEPQQQDSRHPFSIALEDFTANTEREVRAFLVDVDGNNTEGMLVVDLYGFPTGTLFYLHNGVLRQEDVGPQDAGFMSSMTTNSRRLVNLMADGGQWSYTLFAIRDNGDLDAALTIFAEAFIEVTDAGQDGNTQHVFYMSDDFLQNFSRDSWQSITFEKYDELRARYGLDNVRGAWWDMEDESAVILSMTMDL